MAADLTEDPWTRLAKLAPPGSLAVDLQAAADRHAWNNDVNAAAADLWEEKAVLVDTSAAGTTTADQIKRVKQDGIEVEYVRGEVDYSQSQAIAEHAACMAKAKYFRSRAKVKSPLMRQTVDDPWLPYRAWEDYVNDVEIPVIE